METLKLSVCCSVSRKATRKCYAFASEPAEPEVNTGKSKTWPPRLNLKPGSKIIAATSSIVTSLIATTARQIESV